MTFSVAKLHAILVLLTGSLLYANASSADDPYRMRVQEIIESTQSYDGEIIEKLVDKEIRVEQRDESIPRD